MFQILLNMQRVSCMCLIYCKTRLDASESFGLDKSDLQHAAPRIQKHKQIFRTSENRNQFTVSSNMYCWKCVVLCIHKPNPKSDGSLLFVHFFSKSSQTASKLEFLRTVPISTFAPGWPQTLRRFDAYMCVTHMHKQRSVGYSLSFDALPWAVKMQ